MGLDGGLLNASLQQGGRVINIGSQGAYNKITESPTYSAYFGSKAALARMTEAIAYDARPHGVSVFALRPGSVITAMVESMLDDMGLAVDDIPADTWTSPETAGDIVYGNKCCRCAGRATH